MSAADEWDTTTPGADGAAAGEAEEAPAYPAVQAWVTGWLAPMIRRRVNTQAAVPLAWCPQWWRHGEAVDRLEACWRAWEHLRREGTLGTSTWWTQHFDPTWAVLSDPDAGPFAACISGSTGAHEEDQVPPPLPSDPWPPDWWGQP